MVLNDLLVADHQADVLQIESCMSRKKFAQRFGGNNPPIFEPSTGFLLAQQDIEA